MLDVKPPCLTMFSHFNGFSTSQQCWMMLSSSVECKIELYWSGDDGNYVTIIVGWCWTHIDTKLKHRLSPSPSHIVTTAYSTHPGASLIEATKGSQCWYSIAQVRYIEILTRGGGLLVIFLSLVSLCSTLFWELRDSGFVKNLQFCPSSKNFNLSNVGY